jgi:hypothetical protein
VINARLSLVWETLSCHCEASRCQCAGFTLNQARYIAPASDSALLLPLSIEHYDGGNDASFR